MLALRQTGQASRTIVATDSCKWLYKVAMVPFCAHTHTTWERMMSLIRGMQKVGGSRATRQTIEQY